MASTAAPPPQWYGTTLRFVVNSHVECNCTRSLKLDGVQLIFELEIRFNFGGFDMKLLHIERIFPEQARVKPDMRLCGGSETIYFYSRTIRPLELISVRAN